MIMLGTDHAPNRPRKETFINPSTGVVQTGISLAQLRQVIKEEIAPLRMQLNAGLLNVRTTLEEYLRDA